MRLMQLEASRRGARLWRNQVGNYLLADGRRISSGLAVGSADLIGFVPRDGIAVFASVEVKTEHGRVTPEQESWRDMVLRSGGVAGIARSVDDLHRIINL